MSRLSRQWAALGLLGLGAILLAALCYSCEDRGSHSVTQVQRDVPALYRVQVNGKYGFINASGELVVAPESRYAESLATEGLVAVQDEQERLWGFIDYNGKWAVSPQFEMVRPFQNGLAAVRHEWKWGYIDYVGNLIIPCRYDIAYDFRHDGIAIVGVANTIQRIRSYAPGMGLAIGEYFQIDRRGRKLRTEGKQISPAFYSQPPWVVRRNGEEFQFVDGEQVRLRCRFEDVKPFRFGLAPVLTSSGWGAIDKTGALRIEGKYDSLEPMPGGVVAVDIGERSGYVDYDGRSLWAPTK